VFNKIKSVLTGRRTLLIVVLRRIAQDTAVAVGRTRSLEDRFSDNVDTYLAILNGRHKKANILAFDRRKCTSHQ